MKKSKKHSLADKLSKRKNVVDKSPHVIVKAFAGTGKTASQIVGVGWAFGQDIWPEIEAGIARMKGVDPKGFKFQPSDEQMEIWEAIAQSRGKVNTVTYSAFNKSIVREFSTDWGWLRDLLNGVGINLQFATINSLGHQALARAFGRLRVTNYHTENLISKVLNRDVWELKRRHLTLLKSTEQLVGLCKLTMVGWTEEDGLQVNTITSSVLDVLCTHYNIELNGDRDRVYDLVPKVLEESTKIEEYKEMDFNDQNWLPIVLNLNVPKVDLLLLDEAQDLCRAKQEFARKLGRRIIMVGDTFQSIYGFSGADVDSIPRMQRLLSVKESETLYLTETRRCGKAIVAEAQRVVPDFKAHEDNPEGEVLHSTIRTYPDLVRDQDMCLCRVNAPLVTQAIRFIKEGRKAIIRGRDFGGQLINFVKKRNALTVSDLIRKMHIWHENEREKELSKTKPSDNKLRSLEDRVDCIQVFCEDACSVDDVINNINRVFVGKQCPRCKSSFDEDVDRCPKKNCLVEDDPAGGRWKVGPKLIVPEGVVFSSIHKAKGLEADRVFFLMPKGAECPHPMAKAKWERQQEKHCWYIAVTRPRKTLVYVTD